MAATLIITPFKDGFPYFEKTFESVVNQSEDDFEWLVIDDNSEESQVKKLLSYAATDPRISVLKCREGIGAGAARNTGLLKFSHKYLTFIDADDEWHSDFLMTMKQILDNSSFSSVFSGYDRRRGEEHLGAFLPTDIVTAEDIIAGNPISCLTFLCKPDPDEEMPVFGDLKLRNDLCFFYDYLKMYGPSQAVPRVCAVYNLHQGSLSSNKLKAAYWQWKFLREHVRKPLLPALKALLRWARNGIIKYYVPNKT